MKKELGTDKVAEFARLCQCGLIQQRYDARNAKSSFEGIFSVREGVFFICQGDCQRAACVVVSRHSIHPFILSVVLNEGISMKENLLYI